MCGGARLELEPEALARAFRVDRIQRELPFALGERFPGQDTPIVIVHPSKEGGSERVLGSARWGLVPFWAKDVRIGQKLFNARSETLDEKPAFRDSFLHKRCVVPVSAFYEWCGPKGRKQRFVFAPATAELFALAGLWATYRAPDQTRLTTFTVITVAANAVVSEVHERMPALLDPQAVELWLSLGAEPAALKPLLTPSPAEWLTGAPG